MQRAVIKFKNGEHLNIKADYIGVANDFVELWNGEQRLGLIRQDIIDACYLTEKKEFTEVKQNV